MTRQAWPWCPAPAPRVTLGRVSRVLARAALLLGVVWSLSVPPQRLVTIGPPRSVETRIPVMGVHTRLTDEVEEWKIQRTLEMVREMGAPWVVEYFPWAYHEPRPGRYDWRRADLIVDHALAQGLTVIARIDFVPEWARPADTTFRYLDADHYGDYARFVAAFAAHFAGRVGHIIIWNEPNLAFEWGYRLPDPEAYAELLCLTYREAKDANPEVQILAAGMAPTLAPPGSEWGMDDLIFLERLYEAGGGACFDGMAIHAYGLTFPPEEPPHPQEINFRRAELVHELMARYGDGDKPCYITEGGWNDHPRWTKAVRPYQRIEYTIRAYEWAQREWDWCEAVAMWAFRYPWPHKSYQDHFTFVTPEFILKPIYVEVRHYAHGEPYEYLESDPTDLW
jgi:polysaccharide biosynthesis protein PslG